MLVLIVRAEFDDWADPCANPRGFLFGSEPRMRRLEEMEESAASLVHSKGSALNRFKQEKSLLSH